MKNTTFIVGLIGSVLGLLGSLIWLFLGTNFWGGVFMGASGDYYITDGQYGLGFIVTLFQSLITAAGFGIALFKSLPKNIEVNQRKNGLWLLWLGIGIFVINISLFIPCILLVIAGVVAMGTKNQETIQGGKQ
ncbi:MULTISPECIES: hypothetical protein [Peribacillus]|uniref:hypothetical protein n=1 Tax=Peribacillus TaxID=2675229 RepID=UPI001F4E8857|nr:MULTISPECIES: hypothetical protein [unclassified Peribacillus]MCK1982193.1 hypothetical protein [Peribacillus sp. Aquil_B1]MCK2007455.1 hypothetical protein [Peribacillus sp. Aquil_B8]